MQRPEQMHSSSQPGISQGVGIITVLAFGLVALSVVYYVARQQVYADTSTIDFSKLPRTNQNINAPVNAS